MDQTHNHYISIMDVISTKDKMRQFQFQDQMDIISTKDKMRQFQFQDTLMYKLFQLFSVHHI